MTNGEWRIKSEMRNAKSETMFKHSKLECSKRSIRTMVLGFRTLNIRICFELRFSGLSVLRHSVRAHARTGTLAVRSSLPQLTHAPLIARKIAFQMQELSIGL